MKAAQRVEEIHINKYSLTNLVMESVIMDGSDISG